MGRGGRLAKEGECLGAQTTGSLPGRTPRKPEGSPPVPGPRVKEGQALTAKITVTISSKGQGCPLVDLHLPNLKTELFLLGSASQDLWRWCLVTEG